MTDSTPRVPELVVWDITPTHPQGFGGHVFEYDSDNDLFCCVNEGCGKFEMVVRDSATGKIAPCQGATETQKTSGMVPLFMACPLDACNHSLAMHDEHGPTEPPTCRAEHCQCAPEDLANEEWS